jgi:hypothetical protein
LSVDYAGVSVIGERNQKLMYAGEVMLNNSKVTGVSLYIKTKFEA